MDKYFNILRKCPLFNLIEDENIIAVLHCLNAQEKTYSKGMTILAEGEQANNVYVLLSGKIQIMRTDYYGNRSILTNIFPSQLFGESFAFAQVNKLPVDAIAIEDSTILIINAKKITTSCKNTCSFHTQLIFNLLNIVAKKNLVFHQKIEITSKRTTREKLMTYLLIQAKKFESNTFKINYNRQELADYLEVDRSGLSAEISKLRDEKIITCDKNIFTIL